MKGERKEKESKESAMVVVELCQKTVPSRVESNNQIRLGISREDSWVDLIDLS